MSDSREEVRTSSAVRRADHRANGCGVTEGGTPIPLPVPRYVATEAFRPTCPVERCATICDDDALYCVECGARLYLRSSGKYAGLHATAGRET